MQIMDTKEQIIAYQKTYEKVNEYLENIKKENNATDSVLFGQPVSAKKEGLHGYIQRVGDDYFLIGNLSEKDKLLQSVLKDNIDYILTYKYQHSGKWIPNFNVSTLIASKACGGITTPYPFGSPEQMHFEKIEREVYERDYIYADNSTVRECLTKSFTDMLTRAEKLECEKESEKAIFPNGAIRLAYIWNIKGFDGDLPYDFSLNDVGELVNFLRDCETDKQSVFENVIKETVDDHIALCYFATHMLYEELPTFKELYEKGIIKFDYEHFIEDIAEFYKPEDEPVVTIDDRFIYKLSSVDMEAIKYLKERTENIHQRWSVEGAFTSPLSPRDLRQQLEKCCENANINIKSLYLQFHPVNSSPDKELAGKYEINLQADHRVEYYEDSSVGIDGEFEDSWVELSDLEDWFKDVARVNNGTLTYKMDGYDDLYNKYCNLHCAEWKAEEEYIKEQEEREDR